MPQRPLPDSVETELREEISKDTSLAGDLFSAIGVLLTVAVRSLDKRTMTLVEFMDKFKDLHNMQGYRGRSFLTDCSLTLCNIVPLYLTIESVIGEKNRKNADNKHAS